MTYTATVFKCMIASPSDVLAERSIIREILTEWNLVNSDARRIVLLPVGWETHATPEMGAAPQTIINKQVLHGCDLLIGVFWTKLGTATDRYESGTVEEIEEHISAGLPVMLYFSSAPVVPQSIDPGQYARLQAFQSSCKSRGLFETYQDIADFREKLYRQLQLKINRDGYFKVGSVEGFDSGTTELPPFPKMSKEAAFLLKECAAEPVANILNIATLGDCSIQLRGKNLIEQNSPRSEATWKSALLELENLGYIVSTGPKRQIFNLTREGFDAADRLP